METYRKLMEKSLPSRNMAKKPTKTPNKKAAKKESAVKKATAVKRGSSVKQNLSFADPLKLAAKASARKKLNK